MNPLVIKEDNDLPKMPQLIVIRVAFVVGWV